MENVYNILQYLAGKIKIGHEILVVCKEVSLINGKLSLMNNYSLLRYYIIVISLPQGIHV